MKTAAISAAIWIFLLAAGPAAAIEPLSSCQALEAWAAGLEKLPADYVSFTALDRDQRAAVYPRLSPAERAALWRHQMSQALPADGWNEGQRALIAEARELASAETFAALAPRANDVDSPARAAFDVLEGRVAAAFSRAQLGLFYRLGLPVEAPVKNPGVACECSGSQYPCLTCQRAACNPVLGCGFLGEQICDGRCQ